MNRTYAVALGLILSGCAGMMNVKTREAVVTKTQLNEDSFKKVSWLNGPTMKASTLTEAAKKDRSDWQVHAYLLRAMKDQKTGQGFIQLYVSHEDTDWLFFNSAADSDGNNLEFIRLNQEASTATQYGAGIVEDFALSMNEDYLRKKAKDGLVIRVYGKKGNRMLAVPGYYIQGFLDRYETFKATPAL